MGEQENLDVNGDKPQETPDEEAMSAEWKEASRNIQAQQQISDCTRESDKTLMETVPETHGAEKKSEREIIWGKAREEIDKMGDRLGFGIDEGIKETVVAFKVNGLPTSSSCEGHVDRGLPIPWVEIQAPNEPDERFIGQNESFKKMAKKYNITVEQVKHAKNNDAYWEAINECAKNGETEKYKKWEEENKRLQAKARKLLNEFYKDRKVKSDIKLKIDKGVSAFRIHNGEKDYDDLSEHPEEVSDARKQERAKKLLIYRKEMSDFTEFLKMKFLE